MSDYIMHSPNVDPMSSKNPVNSWQSHSFEVTTALMDSVRISGKMSLLSLLLGTTSGPMEPKAGKHPWHTHIFFKTHLFCGALQMITTQKQLIENADAVQEKIAQVQREGTIRVSVPRLCLFVFCIWNISEAYLVFSLNLTEKEFFGKKKKKKKAICWIPSHHMTLLFEEVVSSGGRQLVWTHAQLLRLFGSFRDGLSRGSVSTWGQGGTEGTQAEQSCGEFHLEHHCSQGTVLAACRSSGISLTQLIPADHITLNLSNIIFYHEYYYCSFSWLINMYKGEKSSWCTIIINDNRIM